MAEETTEVTPDLTGNEQIPEEVVAPAENSEVLAVAPEEDTTPPATEEPQPAPIAKQNDEPETADVAVVASEPESQEPDVLQPFIDKAFETIQHEVENVELGVFLRSHIKTFREEWDIWPDSAKEAYVHMMTSQLLQRKAAATQIMIGNEFKLPVPSAQTTLFESIKQSQVKPKKCIPVLLMPPNLRPTYSLKK